MRKTEELKQVLPRIETVVDLKRKTASESSTACPKCGGDDRCCVWPEKQTFWCRQCKVKGDIIEFHKIYNECTLQDLFNRYSITTADTTPTAVKKSNPKTNPGQKLKLVKTYDYRDETGKQIFQVCRFEPGKDGKKKSFSQRRPDGNGSWEWNLKGAEPVLYRLPEISSAGEVIIAEGEKDADNLAAIGFKATTAPMGAGNWRESYNKVLKGKDVVILPDNDGPGHKHAEKVAQALKDIARSIKIIHLQGLAESEDATVWLSRIPDNEQAAEELSRLIDAADPYTPAQEKPSFEFIHCSDLIKNLKPIQWQISDILEEKTFAYTYGDVAHRKTSVEIDRGLCVASGIDYHGHKVKQGPVFYIAGEGQQGIGRRIAAWKIHNKLAGQQIPFFVSKTTTQLMDREALDEVKRAVDSLAGKYGPPAILYIDTLARNFGAGDENATKDMNQVIYNLDTAFGNAFCRHLIHHTGHTNKDRARGSIALHAAADAAYRTEYNEATGTVLVVCTKMKDAGNAPPMRFEPVTVLLDIENEKHTSFALKLIGEGPDATQATGSGSKNVTVKMKKALKVLEDLYAEYEKNLADGRREGTPRVRISDWQEACVEKDLYKRKDSFKRAMDNLVDRSLVFIDKNNVFAYTGDIYLKYITI